MDALRNLAIVITSDTAQAEEGLAGLGASVGEFAAAMGIAFGAVEIAKFGVESVKAAADFQASMTMIQTQAGASAQEVTKMSQAVMDLSASVGTGPEELAQGLYHIESAGFRGAQALDMLKVAAEGAKVGQANLEDVTQAMISATASNIKGISSATQAMGVLNAIVGSGDMRMEDLASAMSSGILPAAATFGLSIQDVGAALATLTDNAVPADEAATRLRMTFSLLAAPTKQASGELASIGLSSLDLANTMRDKGLVAALQELKDHLDAVVPASTTVVKGTKETGAQLVALQDHIKNTQAQLKVLQEEHVKAGVATDKHNLAIQKAQEQLAGYQAKLGGANQSVTTLSHTLTEAEKADLLSRAFGGGKSSSAILTLLDQMDRFKSKYAEISAETNTFGDSWAKTQETAKFQMDQFGANMDKLKIQIGQGLLPVVSGLLSFINSSLIPGFQSVGNWLNQNRALFQQLASFIQSSFSPILGMLNQLWETHKQDLELLAKVIGGVLIVALIALIEIISNAIKIVIMSIDILLTFADKVTQVVSPVIDFLGVHLKDLGIAFNNLGSVVISVMNNIGNSIRGMVNGAVDAINHLINAVNSVAGKVPGIGGGLQIGNLPHFASGGYSSGGLALVGENGPEIVNLPGGSYVNSNQASQGLAAPSFNFTINYPQITSQNDINNLITQVRNALGRRDELARLGAI